MAGSCFEVDLAKAQLRSVMPSDCSLRTAEFLLLLFSEFMSSIYVASLSAAVMQINLYPDLGANRVVIGLTNHIVTLLIFAGNKDTIKQEILK